MAQKKNGPLRLSMGPVQASSVQPQQAARLRTQGVYLFSDTLCEIAPFMPDNWGYVTFPVGRYTYRQWQLMLTSPASIAGVTTNRHNQHIVDTEHFEDYIDTLIIEIDGKAKWELRAHELRKLNAYHNHDTTPGVLRIVFGSPNIHNTDMAEDAYQFGTGNLRSVKLRVKTKPAWGNGMQLVVGCEYAPVMRGIGYFQTTTRYAYTAPGAGNFSITDLAVGVDWSTMWVQGTGVEKVDLTIDRTEVFSGSNWQMRALHEAWGKDVDSLGSGLMIDNFRDGDSVGFDSVTDQIGERRRGADVRLDLFLTNPNTQLSVVIFHCGLFSQQ